MTTDREQWPTPTFCKHCGARIKRMDVTMRRPRGPWVHDFPKTRRCPVDAGPDAFAEPRLGAVRD